MHLHRRDFISRSMHWGLTTVACCSTGCGTMFHSDRIGQPHSRDIDWKVAGLNGLGLIFFFVPGVVAFAVDFYTGAIYLPRESYKGSPEYQPSELQPLTGLPHDTSLQHPVGATNPGEALPTARQPLPGLQTLGSGTFRRITVPSAHLDRRGIEAAMTQQIGRPLSLTDSTARFSPLSHLDHFAEAYQRHQADSGFGMSPRRLFERLPNV